MLLSLALTGGHDLLARQAIPPEIAQHAAGVVFRLYGAYLLVGALAALWAVLTPWSMRARRTERAGLLTVAFATGTLSAVVALSDAPDVNNVPLYSAVSLAMVAVASLARWWSLRDPRPPLPKPGADL